MAKYILLIIFVMSINNSVYCSDRWMDTLEMARTKGNAAIPELSKMAEDKDSSWYVRSSVARALGVINSDDSLKLLIKMLNDNSLVVRTIVVDSIGALGREGGFQPLCDEMNRKRNFNRGSSLWIRKHIIDAMTKTGGKKAIPVLNSYINDKDPEVAKRAKVNIKTLRTSDS